MTGKIAEEILNNHELCDHCIGRLFLSKNTPNVDNAKKIRKSFNISETKIEDCWLCEGLLNEVDHFVDLVKISLKEYEFDSFIVGVKVDEEIITREEELTQKLEEGSFELIKTELKREIGKKLEKNLTKTVDFEKPTIMIVIDTSFDVVDLQINPLFVYGRYTKLSRSIPQTKWHCKICRGKGCKKCNYTGNIYETSVQEIIADLFLKKTKGDDESFHGAGREDVDVRMLGTGRPFVIELKNPVKRDINLAKIQDEINKKYSKIVEVSNLKFSDRAEIARIKDGGFNKIYRVKFKGEKPINIEKLKKVSKCLRGLRIKQLTPTRVSHRRADMVRERYIYHCDIESLEETIVILVLEAESGTYIKELISGDDGRTQPNISEMIGVPCTVLELDVLEIKGE